MNIEALKHLLDDAFDNHHLCKVTFRNGDTCQALIDDWVLDNPSSTCSKLHILQIAPGSLTHGTAIGRYLPLDSFASIELGEQIDVETWHKLYFGNTESGTISSFDGPREY